MPNEADRTNLTLDELASLNGALELLGKVQCPMAAQKEDGMDWLTLYHLRIQLGNYIHARKP